MSAPRKPPAPNQTPGAPNPWPPPRPFWVTRDSDTVSGVVDDYVDVWTAPPIRIDVERGVMWIDADADVDLTTRWGRYWAPGYAQTVGTIPDDDRQCVKYG